MNERDAQKAYDNRQEPDNWREVMYKQVEDFWMEEDDASHNCEWEQEA